MLEEILLNEHAHVLFAGTLYTIFLLLRQHPISFRRLLLYVSGTMHHDPYSLPDEYQRVTKAACVPLCVVSLPVVDFMHRQVVGLVWELYVLENICQTRSDSSVVQRCMPGTTRSLSPVQRMFCLQLQNDNKQTHAMQ